MAQTGYTPIQLYRTTTAAAVPLTANLNPGELAININDADMALYAENASGTVKRLMNNPAGLKYPTSDGTNGQVIKTDGAGVLSWTSGASGSYLALSGGVMTGAITFASAQKLLNWTIKTTMPDPAVAGDALLANTTGGAFTITLPASAVISDTIDIADYAGTFATSNLTINSNSLNLMGSVQTLVLDVNYRNVTLVYSGATQGWVITL